MTIYTDTFTTNTSAIYTSTFNDAGSVGTWTWDTANKRLIATGGNDAALVYPGFSAANGYVEVVMDQADNGGVGVRRQSANQVYVAYFYDSAATSQQNKFFLFNIRAGGYNQMASGSISFTRGTQHTIRLVAVGYAIVLFFDGQILASFGDDQYTLETPGTCEMIAGNTHTSHFLSFTVSDVLAQSATFPTDGYGIYELINPDTGQSVWGPRLDQIATGGNIKLVLNYSLIYGTTANMLAYIAYAATRGLKVIVSLKDPQIWLNNAIAATYPEMSAEATAAGYAGTTDQGFTNYVVDQVKNLGGVWGYYVGDEPGAGNHAALATHSGYVHTRDPNKPRLIIESWVNFGSAFFTQQSPMYDLCEVGGDDYYPIPVGGSQPTAQEISYDLQAYSTLKHIQSAIVLQAWTQGGQFPAYTDMAGWLATVLTQMTPRLILWYSYMDILASSNPTQHWNDLIAAIQANSYHPPSNVILRARSGAVVLRVREP